jgi:hypothetical protein
LKDPIQFLNQDESFTSLTFEQLDSLSIESLKEILYSDKLNNLDENYLLKIILMLIEKDPNKKSLLKNVKLNAVYLKSMKEFLNTINFDDIDFDLFSSMKSEIEHLKEMNEKLFRQNTQLSDENQHLNQVNEQLTKKDSNFIKYSFSKRRKQKIVLHFPSSVSLITLHPVSKSFVFYKSQKFDFSST